MSHNDNMPIWGIDRATVNDAIARGRAERSKAFWAMLQSVLGRPESRDSTDAPSATDRVAGAMR